LTIKIGIPAQDQPDSKFGVNVNYLNFIYKLGRPVIILPENYDNFKEIYNIDALVLPGGADVDSKRYTDVPEFGTFSPNTWLEHFDIKILPNLLGKMPIFGICRGLQTLNVTFGGTLRNLWWHPYSQFDEQAVHKIEIDGKKDSMRVNSFHHQAISKVAPNFVVEAKTSAIDESVIEAISDYKKNIFAVQWHPERLLDEYSVNKFKEILK
jgi:gamma-glutamyl-gamma-aminobutyrate hydrolase PuuD